MENTSAEGQIIESPPQKVTIETLEKTARTIPTLVGDKVATRGFAFSSLPDGRTLNVAAYPSLDADGKIVPRSDGREFTFVGKIAPQPNDDGSYLSEEIRVERSTEGVYLDWVAARYGKDPKSDHIFWLRKEKADPYTVLDRKVTEDDLQEAIKKMQEVTLEREHRLKQASVTQDGATDEKGDILNHAEKAKTGVKAKEKRLKRRVTKIATASVAAITAAAAVTYGVKTLESSPSRPASVEQLDTNKKYAPGSMEAEMQSLEKDSFIKQNENKTVDLSSLASERDDDYTIPHSKTESFANIPSMPLFEVSYDKATDSLRVTNESFNPSDNNLLTDHLLAPIAKNVVLKTAFETGKVDRVFVRLNKEDIDHEYKGYANVMNGMYVAHDDSNPNKVQQSLYLFLPSTTLNPVDYRTAITHEPLHALASGSGLSGNNSENPRPQEFAEWQNVCGDIRKIAVGQIERHSQDALFAMEQNAQYFKDPKIRAIFMEVHDALKRGDFGQEQPTTPDTASKFKIKVPNCEALGPWGAFEELLKLKNIKYEPESEYIGDLRDMLTNQWIDIASNRTIYKELREGPLAHAEGSPNTLAGHPFQEWDETIVSLNNLVLLYPKAFAEDIKKLSHDERSAALKLVDTSVKTLDEQVPQDNLKFHILLRTKYALFKNALT